MKIAVIGSGIMGAGIVGGFLAGGAHVVLLGRSASKCEDAKTRALELAAGLRGGTAIALDLIECAQIDDWDDWQGVDLVIETVTEDLALKQALFAALDARVPAGVPIGSNSSGYPISKIAAGLKTRSRMLGAHYFMPAHIVPLVEVVLGADSDPAVGEKVCAIFRALGKKPVLVKKDIPGFLANRIQHAMMREALALIDSGIASPEDVDLAVRYSFGFRFAAIGPILQKEISGWDTTYNAAREIYPSLSNTASVPRCLAERYAQGKYGMKSGEGFMKWSAEEIKQTRAGYDARLKAAFEILKSG